MRPRLVLRTHYQVDEPSLLRRLICECTSPVRSDYPEAVGARLASVVRASGESFNETAGRYAVDLARALNLTNRNQVWTALGHVLNLLTCSVPHRGAELSDVEKVFFFRVFLEADGGAFWFIAKAVKVSGELPDVKNWNEWANDMVLEVYHPYLNLAASVASRIAIRQVVEKRRKRPFDGKSGAHQMFIHLQTMYRIGMLGREEGGHGRRYSVTSQQEAAIDRFLNLVPTVERLEEIVKADSWSVVARSVLFDADASADEILTDLSREQLVSEIVELYRRVEATGVPLCAIDTLVGALQIDMIADGLEPPTRSEVIDTLEELRARWPRAVRFHVDRYGRPAFIKLSGNIT